jgi:hypothetical protein
MCVIAMSYRNTRPRGSGNRARNPGNDFKRNARFNQCARFLAAASENERVASFQPAHGFAFTGFFDHEPFDAFLLSVFVSRLFADVYNFRIATGFIEQSFVDKAIVEHDVGFAQACQAPHGNQVRISRTSADDKYSSRVLHGVFS